MLGHALKEWTVICRSLAEGRQAILLRKGGIAETNGAFRVEHNQFWLYPTYVHQQRDGIRAELLPLLEKTQVEQPPVGIVRLTHFAAAPRAYLANDLELLLHLQDLHGWSEATVRSRFEYRQPGLFVIPVRVYRANRAHEVPETADYAGCKSWVDLATELPTEDAVPVLDDAAFSALMKRLARMFGANESYQLL
jgi:hypothetical protein